MTPIGAIPGLPAAFGLIIIVFALQLLFRRTHPWMPEILRRIKISDSKLEKTHKVVSPVLSKIDNIIHPRLPLMTSGPAQVLTAMLGITARDGVLILIGFFLSLGVAYGVINLII